jgi:SNF family Na+-dependent transporter
VFLFQLDFSKVTAATVLIAMGLAFFKLSIGMGTMIRRNLCQSQRWSTIAERL